ncbi:MAG: AbiJ-NTD4 domain-containing protein [Flavisolibacter sp.]
MGFAQRIGKKPSIKTIQIESMDIELRNGLWNSYLTNIILAISNYSSRYSGPSELDNYFSLLWHEYFKLPVDQKHSDAQDNLNEVRNLFFKYEWHEVYDFLEFNVSKELLIRIHYNWPLFIQECNRIFEREFGGYRFVEQIIVPISNEVELIEIAEALSVGNSFFKSPYKGVNLHLQEALIKLSDKKNPDYRNSIKESISAVETLCRQLTGRSTLGDSLNSLELKGIVLNQQLKVGFEKLYAYTNSKESGIRHALIDTPQLPTFHEAKFMLVACSAFINFLIPQTKSTSS